MNANPILLISTIVSVLIALVSYLSWKSIKKQSDEFIWNLEYQAFRDFEKEAKSVEFLEIHGINEQLLEDCGLTPEKLRIYLLYLNTLWVSTRQNKYYRRVRRTKDYDKKLRIASKDTWSPTSRTGKILRSESFNNSWKVLSLFWVRSETAVTAPYIEATMDDRKLVEH